MLGKLLKNEIKHSFRYISVIYGIAIVLAGVLLLATLLREMWITVLGTLALYVVGTVLLIMTLVMVIKNFYDTLYGPQGYLTLTLPVKSRTLLLSKILISFFWIVVSFLILVLMMFTILICIRGQSVGELGGIFSAIKESGILSFLPNKAAVAKVVILLGIAFVISMLSFVGFVYFSVSLANTRSLQNHPKFYGILIFLGSYIATNIISSILMKNVPLSLVLTTEKVYFSLTSMNSIPEEALASFGICGIIFNGLVGILMLAVTGYLIEHKVNLK